MAETTISVECLPRLLAIARPSALLRGAAAPMATAASGL